MGKITWNTSAADIDDYEDEGGGYYDGPVPPPSVYHFAIKEILFKTFASGNKGLRVTLDVDDPRNPKKQYNGARAWENVVDTEGSTYKIKQFLAAIGATGKDWANMMTDKENLVTKIGRIKVTDDMKVRAMTKYGTDQNSNQRMEIAKFLPQADDASDDSDDSDDSTGDEEPPF